MWLFSTRWRKGLCSIRLSSETEIRVLSLEPHGTHTCRHTLSTRTHMHPHTALVFLWITRECLPHWLDAQGQVWHESRLMPVFFTTIIQLGGRCTAAQAGQNLCQIPRPQGYSERKDTLHHVTCVCWREETRHDLWGDVVDSMAMWPDQSQQKGYGDLLNHGCMRSNTWSTLYVENIWVW